jgi:hypothetical protein
MSDASVANTSVPPRTGSSRGRRGRGIRGPLVLPAPQSLDPPPARPSRREDFDDLVLSLVERLTARFPGELALVEFGTEDVPTLPPDWGDEPVPFGSLVRASGTTPTRIVLFRRPIELRAPSKGEQVALVNEVLVEHVADLLGRDPSDIDP